MNHIPRRPTYQVYYRVPEQVSQPVQGITSPENNLSSEAESQFIQQFLNADGQMDIAKVLQTVNQLADTVQQIAPVIKQVNDLVKTWKT